MSRLTVVNKFGGNINVVRNDDNVSDKKTHSGLFLEMYNNENIDIVLNHTIEQIRLGGKRTMDTIDGSIIRKIFLLPDEIHLLPRVQFPVCKELLDRIDESKFIGNETFTGLLDDCIDYINKKNNIDNMLFKIIIPTSVHDNFKFYKSYFIPISGLNKDNITIFLYVNETNKLYNYDINKIKDIVMFDICKY
jgi:hypothetical protein